MAPSPQAAPGAPRQRPRPRGMPSEPSATSRLFLQSKHFYFLCKGDSENLYKGGRGSRAGSFQHSARQGLAPAPAGRAPTSLPPVASGLAALGLRHGDKYKKTACADIHVLLGLFFSFFSVSGGRGPFPGWEGPKCHHGIGTGAATQA